jgi:hypothetical protein
MYHAANWSLPRAIGIKKLASEFATVSRTNHDTKARFEMTKTEVAADRVLCFAGTFEGTAHPTPNDGAASPLSRRWTAKPRSLISGQQRGQLRGHLLGRKSQT